MKNFMFIIIFGVSAGLFVGCKTKNKNTNLIDAAWEGDTIRVKSLIASGADINYADSKTGDTALIVAAQNGHINVLKLLIEEGANVNYASRGNYETALMHSVYGGYIKIVKLLLEAGADINLRSFTKQTALDYAKSSNYTDIVALLEAASKKTKP